MKPWLKAVIVILILLIIITAIAFVVYYFYKKKGLNISFLTGLFGGSSSSGTGTTGTPPPDTGTGGTTGPSNTPPSGKTFPITGYGGSTSSSDNSAALLAAIKAAAGTGTVVIPSGTFTISATKITGNDIAIYLMSGAVLQAPASQSAVKWDKSSKTGVVTFTNCNNVSITGQGTIFGNGASWWSKGPSGAATQGPHMFYFTGCKGVQISGNTFLDSPYYNITFINSSNLSVSNCTIKTSTSAPNTDGVHVTDGVSNLTITNVTFNTGEDAVAINSNGAANSNILTTGCTLLSGHGLSIGSQVFGAFTNIVFDKNSVSNCDYGCRIKCRTGKEGKGILTGITFSNLTFKNISNTGIYLTTSYNANGTVLDANTVVTFKDIAFKNITGDSIKNGIVVDIATAKQVLNPIVFSDITFTKTGKTTITNKNNVPLTVTNVKMTS